MDCPDFLMVAQAVDEEQSRVNGLVNLVFFEKGGRGQRSKWLLECPMI